MSNKKLNGGIWGTIILAVLCIIAAITGAVVNINIENGKVNASLTYSEEAKPATITVGEEKIEAIETGQGAIGEETELKTANGEEIKTVEAVESNGPVVDESKVECPEGEECGRGAGYPTLDVSSPQAFANATLGKCIDVDGYYMAQCWDSMSAFFYNYAGHILYTCGTGTAKGTIADGCWQKNAGSDFVMIWDAKQIQAGDIAVYSTGQWGHIGMAMGEYNNGYFTLLGQNQGGAACPGGGAAGNIINLSTRDFIGAFRPVAYIKPEPEPEPEPIVDKCSVREVVKGDTMGAIMKECEGQIKWGAEMNSYANSWTSKKTGKTVFYGWLHGSGYGLLAGDTITRSSI